MRTASPALVLEPTADPLTEGAAPLEVALLGIRLGAVTVDDGVPMVNSVLPDVEPAGIVAADPGNAAPLVDEALLLMADPVTAALAEAGKAAGSLVTDGVRPGVKFGGRRCARSRGTAQFQPTPKRPLAQPMQQRTPHYWLLSQRLLRHR